ncbi:hypothetical protein T4D_3509 [Trichinella pseudospiralis]|uniref:Uncharacterized protein n=1 Tax=Trichinella pseudospiralis TaxID=6337 RepID=A0A0V1FTT7_TRIPS|nr:hypothetical protein T4D_3509 [Trichinella pseudospiralis]
MVDGKRKAAGNAHIVHFILLYIAYSKSRGLQKNDALNQALHTSKCALTYWKVQKEYHFQVQSIVNIIQR